MTIAPGLASREWAGRFGSDAVARHLPPQGMRIEEENESESKDGFRGSKPETKTFVSATAFAAGAALGTDGVRLGLDFVHRHGLIRVRPHLFDHFPETPHGRVQRHLTLDEPRQSRRLQQTFGLRFCGYGIRQIQLDCNTHNASRMEGYRTDPAGRVANTPPGRALSLGPPPICHQPMKRVKYLMQESSRFHFLVS